MHAAKQAVDYVQSISKFAISRPSHVALSRERNFAGKTTSFVPHPLANERKQAMKSIWDESRAKCHQQLSSLPKESLTDYEAHVSLWRHSVAKCLQAAQDTPAEDLVANCFEKAMLAFDMIANQDDNPQLDVVGLVKTQSVATTDAITREITYLPKGPDHSFLIIGRKPDSDLRFPETWGEDTVICDPWAKRTFAVGSMQEEMDLISSATNGSTRCEQMIALPANTAYNSDPNVLYRTADGAGQERLEDDVSDLMYSGGKSSL